MDTTLIAAAFSMTTVLGGSLVLLVFALVVIRPATARRARVAAPAANVALPTETPGPFDTFEPFDTLDPLDTFQPIDSEVLVGDPPDTVLIEEQYEIEAQPERRRVVDTPAAMPAVRVGSSVLVSADSFEGFFDLPQALPPVRSRPRTEAAQCDGRLSKRLERLTRSRPVATLPMPVAPAGVEPIPELEPTEIMSHRPEWAADWP